MRKLQGKLCNILKLMLGELEDIDLEFESQRATPIESVRNNKTEHLNRYFC